jgi:phosphoribulokinase
MYLLSVYFDESTNRRLQRYIDLISEKTGNRFMTEHSVPPHMTISSIEARSVDVLIEPFLQLAWRGLHKSHDFPFLIQVEITSIGLLIETLTPVDLISDLFFTGKNTCHLIYY